MGSVHPYPLAGKVYRVDYGEWAFDYDLTTPGKLTFTGATEAVAHVHETVDVTITPIREDVFVVSFVEPSAAIVVVQDLANNTVNTCVAMPDQPLSHLQGTLVY